MLPNASPFIPVTMKGQNERETKIVQLLMGGVTIGWILKPDGKVVCEPGTGKKQSLYFRFAR